MDAFTWKPNKRPVDANDKKLKHQMQMLLPSKHFEHMVNLQPIEIENKNSLSARTPNEDIINVVDLTKPHAESHGELQSFIISAEHKPSVNKFLTLPEKVKDVN